MTTLSATADITHGAIALDLNRTQVVARITRTDVNGTADVRTMPYQLDGTGRVVMVDYEATHGENTYKALSSAGTVLATASAELTITMPWLSVPVLPELSAKVEQVSDYSASRTSTTVVHQVIGRTDPVVNIGKLNLRQGILEIWTPNLASARILESVVGSGEILMLKQAVTGLDMYFTAIDTESAPYSPEGEATRYRFTIRYVEVARPEASLKGGRGWTFNELATSAFSTFDQLKAGYVDSFDDLAAGFEV